MSWQRVGLLTLALFGFLVRPLSAQTTANYLIRGPGAMLNWGPDQGAVDVEMMAFAFTDMAPLTGDTPPPGPRVVFSATRLSALGSTLIRRQWFVDAPLKPEQLAVSTGLTEVNLQAELTGILEERLSPGSTTRKEAKGTLKIRWVANAGPSNTAVSVNNQGTPVAIQMTAVGDGRLAQATVTVNVEGMGGPIEMTGPGTILSPSAATLKISVQ
jgi:hypothetical protein